MRQLIGVLQQPAYHAIVDALPGYDAGDTGKVVALDEAQGWCRNPGPGPGHVATPLPG